jgi:hypothetical protein
MACQGEVRQWLAKAKFVNGFAIYERRLVEAAGIEPASEKASMTTSTGLVAS